MRIFVLVLICFSFFACDKNYILEQNQQVSNYKWHYTDTKTFTAEIPDTSVNYDLFIHLRHHQNFEWRNVWLKIETTFPDGREFEKRINLLLAEPDGKWLGNCLGGHCDIRIPIQHDAFFPLAGKYKFKLTQDMRVNPLGDIESVGMEIQKTVKQSQKKG